MLIHTILSEAAKKVQLYLESPECKGLYNEYRGRLAKLVTEMNAIKDSLPEPEDTTLESRDPRTPIRK